MLKCPCKASHILFYKNRIVCKNSMFCYIFGYLVNVYLNILVSSVIPCWCFFFVCIHCSVHHLYTSIFSVLWTDDLQWTLIHHVAFCFNHLYHHAGYFYIESMFWQFKWYIKSLNTFKVVMNWETKIPISKDVKTFWHKRGNFAIKTSCKFHS